MVLSGIYILDMKGKVLISRNYRGDIENNVIDKFIGLVMAIFQLLFLWISEQISTIFYLLLSNICPVWLLFVILCNFL